jgi:Uma2 family endonuclease
MAREAFIEWSIAQDPQRYELDGGAVVAMTPELLGHVRAKMRASVALHEAIQRAGLPFEAVSDGFGVVIGDDTLYQPDAMVVCGARLPDDARVTDSPIIIVEVTSPSNSRVDLVTKVTDYLRLPSLRHYLIVHLGKRVVLHHRKLEDGRIETAILGAGALALDPPGMTLSVEALLG